MEKYKIDFVEKISGHIEITAKDKQEAEEKYQQEIEKGDANYISTDYQLVNISEVESKLSS